MSELTISGRQHIVTPGFYVPNRLSLETGRALHHLLGKRVCYLVDSTFPPAPEVMDYLRGRTIPAARFWSLPTPAEKGEDKPVIEYFDFRHTTHNAVRAQIQRHLQAGRSVVFLPGLLARAHGCVADVPSPFLSALGSLHISPVPVFVGHYGEDIDTLFSHDPNAGRTELSILPKLAPGPRTGERLLAAWMERSAELMAALPELEGSLTTRLVQSLRANPNTEIIDGMSGATLSYARLLGLAMTLAGQLQERGEPRIGIILPPGPSATISVLACFLAGITPVMLNYAASGQAFESAVSQAGLQSFITERWFVDRLPGFPWPSRGKLIIVSDLARAAGRKTLLANLLMARTMPAALLCRKFRTDERCGRVSPGIMGEEG